MNETEGCIIAERCLIFLWRTQQFYTFIKPSVSLLAKVGYTKDNRLEVFIMGDKIPKKKDEKKKKSEKNAPKAPGTEAVKKVKKTY